MLTHDAYLNCFERCSKQRNPGRDFSKWFEANHFARGNVIDSCKARKHENKFKYFEY